ncbi:hypothetical protein U9M48_039125 [Paspalum notatum var. saurae]|uniref:DDE Tnp4 domain-containing protein n=1 Tax=Paspalum notatum var. saurae TaxID=547442 RepID=A0AAQ3UIZ3_PASNO
MEKSVFFKLCQKLCNMGALKRYLALYCRGTNRHGIIKKNRDISFHFTRSGETVSRYFNHVLYAIGQLGPEMLRHRSLDIPSKILGNPRFDPYFKDCIGAIYGRHIPCNVPSRIVDRFRGRKPLPTQNVLAVVDFDLMFTYVSAGWQRSAHDSTVLRHYLEHPNGLRVPEGKYYLADAGYATRRGFLPPFRQTRYHLREWRGNRARTPNELFNLRHSSL